MSVYIVSYDLKKPSRDYSGLYNTLKASPGWWHYLESTWLLSTQENADSIYNRLKQHIDADDNILIIEAGRDRQGWLPKDAWEWIRNHI